MRSAQSRDWRKFSRQKWLLLLVLAACSVALKEVRGAEPSLQRPNILFLMADEFTHNCLGVAGHPIVKTPNLDRLARQGVRFTNAYAASPVCSPSRATLFTGRYPHIHGVVRNGLALNPGEVALPELLKSYGYVTHMVGKLHLPPDEWFPNPLITAGGRGKEYQQFLKEKKPLFTGASNTAAVPETLITYKSPCKGRDRAPLRIGTSVLPEELYEEAWVADRAIDFLRTQEDSERPWFLFVSMLKPHSAFVIPQPYATMYRPGEMPLPDTFRPNVECFRLSKLDPNPRAFINDSSVLREVMAHYYGAITLVDRHMGRVLDAVEQLGMSENTIFVFTADHGNMLGERNRMFKGVMYESSVKVPLLLKAPGKLEGGKVIDAVLDNTAVMPTLLELAGISVPAGLQGRSLMAVAQGDTSKWPQTAFSVLRHRMARLKQWKLIVPDEDDAPEPELYDLAQDPKEKHNLSGRPELAEVQHQLETTLEKWWKQKPPQVKLADGPKR
ncbi:MAG: sulfatase [Acidobacteriota bacterium]